MALHVLLDKLAPVHHDSFGHITEKCFQKPKILFKFKNLLI